ncbi:hypothetical protein IWQ60_012208 [Tieghemiomyces parasiticus]|uniref:MYND-type domain-containing protein n=1 Tax=Tieghemiomyces parasiticus TaxID=78921 RepID=A0A9W7ZM44_9FUNG|nr:hypothetical protein IWQ60_012208 [Tieghemiomyces parasiticus]
MEPRPIETYPRSVEPVQLGYAEKPVEDFEEDPFPSKIGGKPVWLDPTNPLRADQVSCGECGKPMPMLLQLYTPEDMPVEAFHRTVYVFCCKNGDCHRSTSIKSFRVYRTQLPEENPFHIMDPPPSSEPSSDADDGTWIRGPGYQSGPECNVCGLFGSKTCGQCKTARYCSRPHQLADWKVADHKSRCRAGEPNAIPTDEGEAATRLAKQALFPVFEIVSEPEEIKERLDKADEERLKKADVDTEVDTKEDWEDSESHVDRAFLEFQRRVLHNPSQVLRYARTAYDQPDGAPLFVSDMDHPATPSDIPACENCGTARTFEFQILPQLLYYLGTDQALPSSLDWGSLFVYSCPANCVQYRDDRAPTDQGGYASQAWHPEVLWKQNFTQDGIGKQLAGGQSSTIQSPRPPANTGVDNKSGPQN